MKKVLLIILSGLSLNAGHLSLPSDLSTKLNSNKEAALDQGNLDKQVAKRIVQALSRNIKNREEANIIYKKYITYFDEENAPQVFKFTPKELKIIDHFEPLLQSATQLLSSERKSREKKVMKDLLVEELLNKLEDPTFHPITSS